MAKRWVACISQTGSELYQLCEMMMRKPDVLLITDVSKVIPEIWSLEIDEVVITKKRPSELQLMQVFLGADVITLHGFLYILPLHICEEYRGKIFNGHPGLITEHEALKGKDPQVRAFGKYDYYGCVLHEVSAVVDDGEIISSDRISAELVKDLDDLFIILKKLSIGLWLGFFCKTFKEENIYENRASRTTLNWPNDFKLTNCEW